MHVKQCASDAAIEQACAPASEEVDGVLGWRKDLQGAIEAHGVLRGLQLKVEVDSPGGRP